MVERLPVYYADGGTDSLPKHINQQAAEPHAHIFVAESRQGAVDALGKLR